MNFLLEFYSVCESFTFEFRDCVNFVCVLCQNECVGIVTVVRVIIVSVCECLSFLSA